MRRGDDRFVAPQMDTSSVSTRIFKFDYNILALGTEQIFGNTPDQLTPRNVFKAESNDCIAPISIPSTRTVCPLCGTKVVIKLPDCPNLFVVHGPAPSHEGPSSEALVVPPMRRNIKKEHPSTAEGISFMFFWMHQDNPLRECTECC